MLTKENILKNFNDDEAEDVIKVYESMILSYSKDIPIFTKFFCTPNIWTYFIRNFNGKDFKVQASGGVNEGDRRIISFNNNYDYPYPFNIIKIINKSKFKNLTHRDYLGALMSLGINREKLGDLRVGEGYAIVAVYEEITEFIISNLNKIGNSPVMITIIQDDEIPEVSYTEKDIIVSSLRIDTLVSKLANISRTTAISLINSNKVLVDYSKVNGKSQEINKDQRITIVGVGKFLIGDIIGTTKSGRFRINIKKYI